MSSTESSLLPESTCRTYFASLGLRVLGTIWGHILEPCRVRNKGKGAGFRGHFWFVQIGD